MSKFCTECGAPLTPGTKFCTSCGTPVPSSDQGAPAQPQPAQTVVTATPKASNYICPNCGGVMNFDAASGHLVCIHCGHTFEGDEGARAMPVSATPVEQKETTHAKTVEDFLERAPWESAEGTTANAVVYSCPSCGASVAADQSAVSTSCPYCGNNMLVSGIASSQNLPDAILPFSVTREQAEERMREHFQHKWYLSRAFDASLEHLQGVYVPYHLYDVDVQGWADYIGYRDEGDDEHETRYYYPIKRAGHASFRKIPIDSSSKMPDSHMDAIAPFDFNKLCAFSPQYIPGYLTEVADEDVAACQPRAEELARSSFEKDLKQDARDERGIEGIDETVAKRTDVYVNQHYSCVLPVWLMHCTWAEYQMLFAVNGETGRCVGDLPVDGKRRMATIVGTLLGVLIAAVMIYIAAIRGSDISTRYIIGAIVVIALVTFGVDSHFMSQMRTAVEASDAHMSYTDEGLVVTQRWRGKRHVMESKAKKELEKYNNGQR